MPCCAALSPLDGGHFSPCAKANAGRRQYNCQTLDLIFFGACMSVVSSGGSIAPPGTIAPRNSPANQSANRTRGQVGGSRAISCSFDNMQQCIPGYRGGSGQRAGRPVHKPGVGCPLRPKQFPHEWPGEHRQSPGGGAPESWREDMARRNGRERVFQIPDTSPRPSIRRQPRTAPRSVAPRFYQLPNVAAVFPKGGWGWIDSDRCWRRNREHLLKVHRLDRDWGAMEEGGGDVRQQEYGRGIGTGPEVEEQKGFGYRVRQVTARPRNTAVQGLLADGRYPMTTLKFLKTTRVAEVREGTLGRV